MKLQKHNFKISQSKEIILNKNISFPIYDYKALFYYVKYRDEKINKKYLDLLPYKISDLKIKKNELLSHRTELKKLSETTFKDERINLYEKLPRIFKSLNSLCEWVNTEQKFTKYIYRNQKKQRVNKTTEFLKFEYYTTENLIFSLNYFIKFLEEKINFYQKEQQQQNKIIEMKINTYDLIQLENGIITNNINAVYYFHIIHAQKTKISNRTNLYLNHSYIKDVLKKYSNMANKDGIKNDFDLIAQNDLIKFENLLMNKSI
jgi:hypothetical protein